MEKGKINDLGEELVVTIDLPGIKKEDVSINYGEDYLEINASRKSERMKEDENVYVAEKIYRKFYRKINLPSKIIPDKSSFNIIGGMLQIIAPKKI